MDWWQIILLIGVFGFIAYWLFWRNRKSKYANWVNGAIAESTKTRQTTPLGVTVYSKSGISENLFTIIDTSLVDVFADARDEGYTKALDHSFYDVFIPEYACEPSPETHTISFKVRADEYDGTEFDAYSPKGKGIKDGIGIIFAAEMIRSVGTPGSTFERGQFYVCSDGPLYDAVRHGAEHIIIANNDAEYFEQTWFHGPPHPLLPKSQFAKKGFTAFDSVEHTPGKKIIRVVK